MSSIAAACADLERAARTELERTYPERLYRAVRDAIDEACDEVELVNLAGGGDCPRRVAGLIEYLQRLAREPVALPGTSVEAEDVLFHLSDALLGHADDLDDPDAQGEHR
jgi:hypothetical protein